MQEDQLLVKIRGGLNLDSEDYASNSEWTFLQNGVIEGTEGDIFPVQIEPGFNQIDSIPYIPIGSISLSRTKKVIFSTDNINSEIGILNNDVYSTLINHPDLNFSTRYLIRGQFNTKNGCETIILFNDFLNPDRLINIDSLSQYQDSSGDWIVDLFSLNRSFNPPKISNLDVRDGNGNLYLGLYSFAIELLDVDLNSIGFSPISQPVSIYQSRTSENYFNIQGGYNLDDSTESDGGVIQTNKSILITIEDLDTRFDYFRIWILEKKSLEGSAINVYKKSDILPINSNSYSYLFTGIASSDITEDVENIVIVDPRYERSRTMTQVDNVLIRANLKSEVRDYSGYQRIVNNIGIKWTKKEAIPFDVNSKGTSRNPSTYFDSIGFMGGEIYAPAIQFLYANGTQSPAFPIPGRESVDSFDKQLLTVGVDIDDVEVEHLNLTTNQVERYKVYDTSSSDGTMSYYESPSSTYPLTKDCNDQYIFGDLAGESVRFPKFPDRRKVPVYSGSFENIKLNVLGFEFDNIVYPDSDIIAHRFLIVKRTEENKTVLDNGIFTGTRQNFADERIEYTTLEDGISQTVSDYVFWSPETLVNRKYLNGTYIYLNGWVPISSNTEEINTYSKEGGGEFDIRTKRMNSLNSYLLPERTNISIDRNILIDTQKLAYTKTTPETFAGIEIDSAFFNNSFTNTVNYIKSTYPFIDNLSEQNIALDKPLNASIKRVIDPYSNIQSLVYYPISDWKNLSDSQIVFNGDTFISEFSFLDLFNKSLASGNRSLFFGAHISKTWVESTVNYELIHAGTGDNERYSYPNIYGDYWIKKIATPTDQGTWIENTSPAKEYYGYNKNYSFIDNSKKILTLPITYNYCSECKENYPNRIIFSEESFVEELSDSYRVFKTNNYIIVGQNSGEITALHYDKNRILVRTEQSRFQLAPNPQVLNTDIDTAYLGTGDFLSIPPNELVKTDYGYGGGRGKLDEINTEYGLISVDEQVGQIHIFGSQKDELSSEKYKCNKFLRRNLPLVLKQIVPEVNDEARIQLVYDPEYKRLIINKIDFEPINYKGLKEDVTEDGLVYSIESGFEYKKGNTYILVNFTDTQYFINKCWVLSYSLTKRYFIGFHKYLNHYLFENNYGLYSIYNSVIRKQVDNTFANYIGIDEDFICEITFQTMRTVDLEQVMFYAESFKNGHKVEFPTFDRLWVYTSDLSTGIVNLIPKYNYSYKWSNLNKVVSHTEKNYFINKLAAINSSNEIQDNDIIDRTPINVNYNTKQRDLIPLRDKYFKLRFYFKSSQIKILFDFVHTIIRNSEL